jgi:hypothetical protein
VTNPDRAGPRSPNVRGGPKAGRQKQEDRSAASPPAMLLAPAAICSRRVAAIHIKVDHARLQRRKHRDDQDGSRRVILYMYGCEDRAVAGKHGPPAGAGPRLNVRHRTQ